MCFCWWSTADDALVMPSSLMMTTHLANWGKMSFHRNKASANNNNNNSVNKTNNAAAAGAPNSPAKSPKVRGNGGSKRSLSCATSSKAEGAAGPPLLGVGVKLDPVGSGGSMCAAVGNSKHGKTLKQQAIPAKSNLSEVFLRRAFFATHCVLSPRTAIEVYGGGS